MTLRLIALGSVFLTGITVGVFALLIVGIQLDTRRMARGETADTRVGSVSRRLLTTSVGHDEGRRSA